MSQTKRGSDSKVKGQPTKSAKSAKDTSKPTEKRASFVLRLSLDEHNQVRRSEFQHVQSNKKQSSATLQCERLLAFIESCIGPLNERKTTETPKGEDTTKTQKAEIKATEKPDTPSAKSQSSIKSAPIPIKLSRVSLMAQDNFVVWNNPTEPLKIGVHFVLEDAVDQPVACTVQVYARSIDRGGSSLIASHNDHLLLMDQQYSINLEIEQLPTGLHQLSAVVRIAGGPMGYCEGLMVQVNQFRVLPVDASASRFSLS